MTSVETQQRSSLSETSAPLPPAIAERVAAYLRRLGMQDPAAIDAVAAACLQRASRRAAPGAHQELLRRALEEALRRFDNALAQCLNLQGSKNLHGLAAARAGLLVGDAEADVEKLLVEPESMVDEIGPSAASWPRGTPPEAALPMHPQPISFFFSPPSPSRK